MQIPASPHELTADWLASVLDGQGLEPDSIQSFDLELLGGEQGMTGQLVRARRQWVGRIPGDWFLSGWSTRRRWAAKPRRS